MTSPWTPGDKITSAKLNQMRDDADRISSIGISQSTQTVVNDALGHQSVLHKHVETFMVIAAEDFLLPESPTDLYAIYDNIPSGRCFRVRLNKYTGQQDVSDFNASMRVYDPIAEITGASTITKGDVFYCSYNHDNQRYEANLTDASMIQVMLLMDLEAAEDYLTNPSYATAAVLRKKDDGDLRVTGLTITVTNRFKRISHSQYMCGVAAWFDREWQMITADCPSGSSESSESVDDYYYYREPEPRGDMSQLIVGDGLPIDP